ncbi:hypothetical protein GLOIN_2v1776934 [Rhizophagus irregularis DAOM 181602=DAOM 197198]|uniref:CCHC-type domain-containing protein n=1 Tax=Rhizophagus irregularis (strain DAOM 181602 / DAOM 197198 / MUCL 43194) TaxID=747089 RepID=A0A2P4PVT6_RHIID|nr:hypothetical protein GLOIN_2v1776934 [Rhizophagus irregularis DAOM 181602=DAOM 197198]POG69478.1 hypothetical protein GLOIN_2v1776934 [Rhizophagus irregularis DAOM 181602=DAOM 197198]|eukprot:XP_025176344.1 hypothetical protein GLOIN_2v1776934 [Rhizophagus irregularis DAOM 181602=DAOM 197198]
MQHLTFSRKAFYLCRNALSIELFEQKWKSMIDLFPECQSYMTKALYPNRSTVNSTSTLCDVEKAIDKRHESESKYCQLIDLKARQLVTSFIEDLESNTTSGLSQRENLVALLSDGTHLCTCIFENSPVLSAIEPVDTSTLSVPPPQNNFTLQIAFSTAKTAINVALKTKTDEELIKILKDFIAAKHEIQSERNDHTNNNLEVNNYTEDQLRQDTSNIIIPLQQHLIGQITNPNVTKIQGAPSKKRLKSAMELSKKWIPMQKNLNDPNYQVAKSQYRCLLCGKPGHYQKKCPNARDGKYRENYNRREEQQIFLM